MRARSRRRDAAADHGRRCRQSAVHRGAFRPRRDSAWKTRPIGLPGLRLARRRLPVPGHGRHAARWWAKRSGWLCRTRPWPPRASRSGSTWPAAAPRRSVARRTRARHARHPHRRRAAQRHGRPCGLRRLDEPASAYSGDRLRGGPAAADGRRLDALNLPASAAGRCPAQRPGRPSDGAGVPGRRRAGGHAALARRWAC